MDFDIALEQRLVRETAEGFAAGELEPNASAQGSFGALLIGRRDRG